MSAKKPDVWFPLVVGDYLKDTARLTTEQHGAYLLLLMDYWTNGPPFDDDEELAGITRMPARRWKELRPKLLRFFTIVDGQWRQKRIDAEIVRWTERKEKFAERAAAGGRAKAAKSNASSTATSTPEALLAGCTSSSPTVVGKPTPVTLEDKSSKAPDPLADPDRMAWETATRVLTVQGAVGEKSAKAFFGRLLSQHGLEARDLLAATVQAQVNQTGDPQGYLTKAAASIAKRRAPPLKAVGFV